MKILLTGAYKYTETQLDALAKLGMECVIHNDEMSRVSDCDSYDAVVCNGLFLYNEIREFKSLRYIQLTSAGMDRIPMKYITENNIKLNNARGVYSIPMAEHAILKILEIYKKSKEFYNNQKQHKWVKNRRLTELYGKTAAIIGCGSVGCEIAKRLKAFGTYIIGVDIFDIDCQYTDINYNIEKLDEALQESDIVILTLPLTDATRHLFNSERFKCMKKEGILVNVARGAIVDENALIYALKNQQISGAALDVFEEEPLGEQSPLWDMDNVVITPHNSFIGEGNSERLFNVIYTNLKDWMRENG